MDENHRQLIKDHMNALIENCNVDNILGFLKCRNIFTERELQIYASPTFLRKPEEEKCRQIFTDIQTRGPTAFFVLLECLNATNHVKQYTLLRRGRVTVPSHNENTISVKKSKSFPSDQNVYRMKSYPKGYFIFINNINFEGAIEREGAEKDEGFIDTLKEMGFDGVYHKNKTVQQMWDLLSSFAAQESLAEVDSCVVLLSSHGKIHGTPSSDRIVLERELVIDGVDDITSTKFLLCTDIIALFNSDSCKLRKGCPKIFIFQACRGNRYVFHGAVHGESVNLKQSHPNWRDSFLLAPSMEGFLANRDPNYGSWLFMALKEVFPEHAHNKDLETMKDLINKWFDRYVEATCNSYQQTLSYYEYGVSKKLYFNPGLYGSRDDSD